MLYSSYREKLAKRKRTFERVWRFRLPIFAGCLLLLALVCSLLGVKGIVYGEEVPESVVYGEPLSVAARAVFGDAVFEYRAAGEEEWTREEPVYAGVYECRAVGTTSVGTLRSGEVRTFRILPARTEVLVKDEALTFGDDPTFTARLCYGDVLHVTDYVAELVGDTVMVTADAASITAVSAEGRDVTSSYEFVPVQKSVADVFRHITVASPDVSFEYDGLPHGSDAPERVTGLAEGHTLRAEFPTLTEAGSCENAITLRIFDENGEDVTRRYAVAREAGTLTVTRRKITVKTAGESFEYDGAPHAYNSFELSSGTLAAGQQIELGQTLVAEAAGSYPNAPEISVHAEEDGRDVTHNYDIAHDFGTVEILQRPITVETAPVSAVYDGLEHVFPAPERVEGTLAKGQQLRFSAPASAVEAGEYPNAPTVSVYRGDEEVTENYAVTTRFSDFVITPAPVTLHTSGETLPYDGEAHVYRDLTVTAGALAPGQRVERTDELTAENAATYPNRPAYRFLAGEREIDARNYAVTEDFGTVVIQKLAITVETEGDDIFYDGKLHTYADFTLTGDLAKGQEVVLSGLLSVQNFGEYTNKPSISVRSGEKDTTQNYDITEVYGSVVIKKLKITVETAGEDLFYDGKLHTYADFTLTGELAEGQEVVLSELLSVQNFGEYTNKPSISVRSGERDTTQNYDITEVYGSVVIQKLAITVETAAETRPYSGKPQPFPAPQVSQGELAEGQELHFAALPEKEDVGVHQNDPAVSVYAGGTDVSQNYDITTEYAALTITPLEITVTTVSDPSLVYDGTEHSYSDISLSEGSLAEGQRLVRTDELAVRKVGVYPNVPTYHITDGTRTISNNNYTITENFGSVTVQKRPLSVVAATETFVYDGIEHTYGADTFVYQEGTSLAAGDRFVLQNVLTVHNVTAAAQKNAPVVDIWDEEGSTLENYDFHLEEGAVTVQKRPLSVAAVTDTFYYDGIEHTYGADTLIYQDETSLAAGDGFVLENVLSAADANEAGYQNRPTVDIRNASGSALENYDFELREGVIVILRRVLRVETDTASFVYNGKPQGRDGAFVVAGSGSGYGLAIGQTLKAEGGPRRTDVGSEQNILRVTIVAAGVDVTKNYDIQSLAYGTLTVEPRPITLGTKSARWEYDGEPHSLAEAELRESTTLADGQSLSIEWETSPSSTDAGTWDNNFTYRAKIATAQGGETTGNYSIKYSDAWGQLEIYPRAVKLKTGEFSIVYDGEYHTADYCTEVEGSLVKGHSVQASYTSIKDVTRTPNLLYYSKVVDGSGRDVTKNYQLTWQYGILHIYTRQVTLTTDSSTAVYDGTPHAAEGYAHSERTANRLVEKHAITLSYRAWTDAGSYPNAPTGWTIRDEAGEDVSANYEIVWENGTVEIKPRPVSLLTGSEEWVYDAQRHTAPSFGYNEADYAAGSKFLRFVEGDTVVIDEGSYPGIIKAGETENKPTYYTLWRNGSTPVNIENYEITWTYGTLSVTKRPITVRTQDVSWVYDGNSHAHERELLVTYYLNNSLGHTVAGLFTPHYDVGEYDNECETIAVYDEFNNIVTENYEISTEFTGTVSISKRPVKFTSQSRTWVMEEGREYAADGYIVEPIAQDRGLLNNHYPTFTATRLKAVTDTADAPVYVENIWTDIRIYNEWGVECTQNYEIETEWGHIRVKAPVVVRVFTVSKQYDGTPLGFMEDDWFIESLPPDVTAERVSVELGGTLVEPGSLTLQQVREQSVCTVTPEDENDVNRVDFIGSPEPLRVTERVLYIKTISIVGAKREEPLYGTDTDAETFWVSRGSLVEGHRFAETVTVTGVLSPEETFAQNTISEVIIYDALGNDVTRYYQIIYDLGSLTWSS